MIETVARGIHWLDPDVRDKYQTWENIIVTICEDLELSGTIRPSGAPAGIVQISPSFMNGQGYCFWFIVQTSKDPIIKFKVGFNDNNLVFIKDEWGSNELLTRIDHPLSINKLKGFIASCRWRRSEPEKEQGTD